VDFHKDQAADLLREGGRDRLDEKVIRVEAGTFPPLSIEALTKRRHTLVSPQ
jgi:hypothetical protein